MFGFICHPNNNTIVVVPYDRLYAEITCIYCLYFKLQTISSLVYIQPKALQPVFCDLIKTIWYHGVHGDNIKNVVHTLYTLVHTYTKQSHRVD